MATLRNLREERQCTLLSLRSVIAEAAAALEQDRPDRALQGLQRALRLSRDSPEDICLPAPPSEDHSRCSVNWKAVVDDDRACNAFEFAHFHVRIHTFGRFGILVDQEPLTFSAKTPKKPLELLKVLIALGGRSVDIDELMRIVWRERGCAARPAFDVALMRLRRLLGSPHALLRADGKLTLNERICWVDAWAFEQAVSQIGRAGVGDPAQQAVDLYRGRFLDRESDVQWVLNVRHRLAEKFRRVVLTIACDEERCGNWEIAAHVYRRALEHDYLTEEFYCRLMHCEWRLGQRAQAVSTYRRCRDVLSINLRVKPSADLEVLYRRVIAA